MITQQQTMEQHLFFPSHGQRVLGVLHRPEGPPRPGALVFLHGWSGYRIGPHQMFTKSARQAAELGFASLRFDFRGRGDSEGDASATTLSTMIEDAVAAARLVCDEMGVERVALIGDCSGSEVAIGAGVLDERIDSLVLWSAPIVAGSRAGADAAKRRSTYASYLSKLFRRETWAKLIGGRLQPRMIMRALTRGGKGAGEEGAKSDREIDWYRRFVDFGGRILFIYGGNDPLTTSAVGHYRDLSEEAGREFEHHVVEGANHAFYSLGWEREVMDVTLEWLVGRYPATSGGDG
ncbi:MAG: alpha/beta fold hydrolase [candidate division WS1 bacterium]|nr:alpha/beta fold hydrolase [candidate division WS1 bacterium]